MRRGCGLDRVGEERAGWGESKDQQGSMRGEYGGEAEGRGPERQPWCPACAAGGACITHWDAPAEEAPLGVEAALWTIKLEVGR